MSAYRFFKKLSEVPYVVLLGDVGTGKSMLVEKLTGHEGMSKQSSLSVTRETQTYWTKDGSLIIADTPGSNALQEKLDHNLEIAVALNYLSVSRILVIVKADTRIDNVVEGVRKYAERLVDLEEDIVGVIVTHMDTVTWTGEEFLPWIEEELGLGIEDVIFSGEDTSYSKLLGDIHSICKDPPYKMTIDHENFLRFFKINNNQVKLIKSTNRAVDSFKKMKDGFEEIKKAFSGKDLIDLLFEFNTWMDHQILVAQKKMTEENNFTFYGESAANEAGHIANMTNQLKAILYDIRVETAGVQSEHGVEQARRCPHCNEVWFKIEGCDGSTTCGNRPSQHAIIDVRDPSFGVLGTYTFKWNSTGLTITKTGTKDIRTKGQNKKGENKKSFGCGKSINWKAMPLVELPSDLKEAHRVNTDDVQLLPDSLAGASGWNREVDGMLKQKGKSLKTEKARNGEGKAGSGYLPWV